MAPNFQRAFLYTIPGELSQADRLARLKRDFGEPIAKRELEYEKKRELFGDPGARDFKAKHIVPVRLAPHGIQKSIEVNAAIRDAVDRAFAEIARFSREQSYELRDLYGYYFRYIKNSSTESSIRDNPRYIRTAKPWGEALHPNRSWSDYYNIWAATYDRDVGGGLDMGLVSNHAWGTAFDINAAENPLHGLSFDMPRAIVEILRKHGFCWGGYYKGKSVDAMHFEYKLHEVETRRVYFPLCGPDVPDSAPRNYYANEAGRAGYYPVSLNQTLHGGAHVHPEEPAKLTPVASALPGYVIAARFLAPGAAGDNQVLREVTDHRPLSFVVIRHELVPREGGVDQPDKAFPLYSVYMHLELPRWDGAVDAGANDVPWLRMFLSLRHGGVVDLDPESKRFRKTLWASEKPAEGAAAFKVNDGPDVPAKKGGRAAAFAKPPPEDVQEAVEAFQKGAVVTFAQPLLQVGAGETIGFVTAGTNRKSYLHWEFFAPSGSASGVTKLLELAGDAKDLFKRVKESGEDNFLELPGPDGGGKNEVEPILLETLPQEDRSLLDGLLDSAGYATALTRFFNSAQSFAKEGDDQAATKDAFTYPLKLSLKNVHDYKGGTGGPSTLSVSFTRNTGPIGKSGTIQISDFRNLDFVIQVPAGADTIRLSAEDFFLDPVRLPPDAEANARLELLKTLVPFRWRNVVLEHVNEWRQEGLAALVDELKKLGRLDAYLSNVDAEQDRLIAAGKLDRKRPKDEALKLLLRPLTWWGRKATDDDPHGEVAILGPEGSEESLFGTAAHQLPADAKIDNLHPVTAAWLADVASRANKVSFRDRWPAPPLLRSESNAEPPFCSWIPTTEEPKVGDLVHAVVIQHGYGSDEQVTFKLKSGAAEPLTLARCTSDKGVFGVPILYWFWGSWELVAYDVSGAELKPLQAPTTQLETKRPEIAVPAITIKAVQLERDKKKVPGYAASLEVADHCPSSLGGYVYFRTWRVSKGETPEYSRTPQIGRFVIPVVAQKRTTASPSVKNVVIENGFVRKAKTALTPVTQSFTFGEFSKEGVFEGALADFRVSYALCKRLQELRSKSLKIRIETVEADGLTLGFRALTDNKANYDTLVKALERLPAASAFSSTTDDETRKITLSYAPPAEEPGELTFEYEAKAALAKILEESELAPGDGLYVKPSFIAPNGGHYVHDDGTSHTTELALEVDLDSLRRKSGDVLELHSDLAMGPFKKPGMGALNIRMGATTVVTEIELFGDLQQWKKAAPKVKLDFGGKTFLDGTISGQTLTASWILFKDSGPIARWGKDLSFSIQITHPEAFDAAPALPDPLSFHASPALRELTAVAEGSAASQRLVLVGNGHCIPTTRELVITCEVQDDTGTWVPDVKADKLIKYKSPSRTRSGLCDGKGEFVAFVDVKCYQDGRTRRFTWKRAIESGKIGGIALEPKSVEYP